MTKDFFSRVSASALRNGSMAAGNGGFQVFGGKYTKIEDSVTNLKDGVMCADNMIRKPVAACVIETQSVDRYGSPFIRKDVRVYLQNPDNSVDGTFISMRLNPDSKLQPGQWLDIETLQSYQCQRSGVRQNGFYAEGEATETLPSKEILHAIDAE